MRVVTRNLNRTKSRRMAVALSLMGLLGARMAAAHHSFASFEMGKTMTLTGTVHAFEWTNPHSWIWLDVADGKGGTVTWGLEGAAPGELTREGWSKRAVNAGDKISVDIHPLKNGQNGGSFSVVTFADGHVLGHPLGGSAPPGSVPGG